MKMCSDITENIKPNVLIAENQDEYQTVHAFCSNNEYGLIAFAITLNEAELINIRDTGRIYITILTFGGAMQPIYITGDPNTLEQSIAPYITVEGRYDGT